MVSLCAQLYTEFQVNCFQFSNLTLGNISTGTDYHTQSAINCGLLQKLHTNYIQPLSKYLSSQNQYTLFGDIQTIYEKNIKFQIALQHKYKTFDPKSSLIGDEIIKFWNPDLRILYQNYVLL